jgi:hypothetical protein
MARGVDHDKTTTFAERQWQDSGSVEGAADADIGIVPGCRICYAFVMFT